MKLNVEEAKAKQRTSDVDEGLKKGGKDSHGQRDEEEVKKVMVMKDIDGNVLTSVEGDQRRSESYVVLGSEEHMTEALVLSEDVQSS